MRRSVRSTKRAVSRGQRYTGEVAARRAASLRMQRALTDVRMTDPSWVDVGSRTVAAAAAAGARAAAATLMDRKIKAIGLDTNFSEIVSGAGRCADLLYGITAGSQLHHRVARDITVTGLRLSFTLESSHNHVLPLADEYNNVRVVVALFNKPGQAETSAYFSPTTSPHNALVPEVESGLVKIFYDKVHLLRPIMYVPSTGALVPAVKNVFVWIPMNEKITYTSDSAAGGNNKQLVLFMCSDSTVAPHPDVTGNGNATIFFRG